MVHLSEDTNTFIDLLQGRTSHCLQVCDRTELFGFLERQKLFVLSNNVLESFNEADRAYWTEVQHNQAIRSLNLTSILMNLLRELISTGIEPIPIKGPVLAQRLYGDVSKRHSGDLDLIVKKSELLSIIEIVEYLGFQLVSPKSSLTQKQIDYFFKYKNEYCVYNEKIGLYMELHVGIYNHGLLAHSKGMLLLKDLMQGKIGGIPIMEMNVNNTFLYLAYHGAHHQYYRLFWLRDIATALKIWNLDHRSILNRARTMGIERLLVMSIDLSSKIFNSIIPLEYYDYLEEHEMVIRKLSGLCMNRFFGKEKLNLRGKIQRQYFLISLKPGVKYKWTVVTNILHRWYIRKFLGGH